MVSYFGIPMTDNFITGFIVGAGSMIIVNFFLTLIKEIRRAKK